LNASGRSRSLPKAESLAYRIITVGNQSTGKSTLLEAVCGDNLSLPKGNGMVTRSPIQIALRKTSEPCSMSCYMEVSFPPLKIVPYEYILEYKGSRNVAHLRGPVQRL
jgi:septin family protein